MCILRQACCTNAHPPDLATAMASPVRTVPAAGPLTSTTALARRFRCATTTARWTKTERVSGPALAKCLSSLNVSCRAPWRTESRTGQGRGGRPPGRRAVCGRPACVYACASAPALPLSHDEDGAHAPCMHMRPVVFFACSIRKLRLVGLQSAGPERVRSRCGDARKREGSGLGRSGRHGLLRPYAGTLRSAVAV